MFGRTTKRISPFVLVYDYRFVEANDGKNYNQEISGIRLIPDNEPEIHMETMEQVDLFLGMLGYEI